MTDLRATCNAASTAASVSPLSGLLVCTVAPPEASPRYLSFFEYGSWSENVILISALTPVGTFLIATVTSTEYGFSVFPFGGSTCTFFSAVTAFGLNFAGTSVLDFGSMQCVTENPLTVTAIVWLIIFLLYYIRPKGSYFPNLRLRCHHLNENEQKRNPVSLFPVFGPNAFGAKTGK